MDDMKADMGRFLGRRKPDGARGGGKLAVVAGAELILDIPTPGSSARATGRGCPGADCSVGNSPSSSSSSAGEL